MEDNAYICKGKKRRSYDQWLADKTGLPELFTTKMLYNWQLAALSKRAAYAAAHSSFYRSLYAGYDVNDPLQLPFIREDDIRNWGYAMACMPGSEIQRVVSMYTSGSTGKPKRLYFSEADLELTIDFFAQGMLNMTGPGQRVLICMNGRTPDGLGDLLSRGLRRIGAEPFVYGEIRDYGEAARVLTGLCPHCIVGIPRQILALAELTPNMRPCSVLLSGDNIPPELRRRVEWLWQTEVFGHWGMRETGLGGAVECHAHCGQHIRHADLFIEIIDPESGRVLPAGETGEVVISTLTREAQPLLRYRTGDYSRLLYDICPCGSLLPRLDQVAGHKDKITEEDKR